MIDTISSKEEQQAVIPGGVVSDGERHFGTAGRNVRGFVWKLPLHLIDNRSKIPRIYSSMLVNRNDFDSEGYYRSNDTVFYPQWEKDRDRVNVTWSALGASLMSIQPNLLTGVSLLCDQSIHMCEGLTLLYVFLFKAFIKQGYNKAVEYVKAIKNWALHYALRALGEGPSIPRGMLGATPCCLLFPWAKGPLAGLVCPPGPIPDDISSHALFQIYLCGKSLALPNADKVEATLRKHREDYTRVFDAPNLTRLARKWSELWAMHLTRKAPSEVRLDFKFGSGSSLTSSRVDGGKNQDADCEVLPYSQGCLALPRWVESAYNVFGDVMASAEVIAILELNEDGYKYLPRRYQYLTLAEVGNGIDNSEWLARDIALAKMYDDGRLLFPIRSGWVNHPFRGFYGTQCCVDPLRTFQLLGAQRHREVEISVVEQRGDKARPVNISAWEETVLAQGVRGYLYTLAKEDVEIPSLRGQSGLAGFITTIRRKLQFHFKGEGITLDAQGAILALEILSLDLSRCSDLILGSLNQAFLEGHFYGSRAKHNQYLSWVWLLSASHRKIRYRGHNVEDIEHCNAAPAMGDPPTWWVDNAYTKFVSMLSDCLSRLLPRVWKGPVDFDSYIGENLDMIVDLFNFNEILDLRVRCGDDEIAFANSARNILTTLIYPLIGGKLSEGTNSRSNDYGAYCEAQLKKGHCGDFDSVGQWVDLLRIRSFTRPELGVNCLIPSSWMWGRSVETTLSWYTRNGAVFKLGCDLCRLVYFKEIEELYRFGLNAHAPTKLGGLSYPCYANTAWKRATRLQKDYYCVIANITRAHLSANMLTAIEVIATSLTDKLGVSSYSVEDSQEVEKLLEVLQLNGEIQYVEDIAFSDGKSMEDYPYSNWKKLKVLRTTSGIIQEYVTLQSLSSSLRTRLMINRGVCYRSTKFAKDPPNASHAQGQRRIADAMLVVRTEALTKGLDLTALSQQSNASTIAVAMTNYEALVRARFVRSNVLDETVKVKAKQVTALV